MFLLSKTGQCETCEVKVGEKEIVQCRCCDQRFHAICGKVEKHQKISSNVSFFQAYLTAKANFSWACDVCLTKEEESQISTVNEKFCSLSTDLANLTTLVQNLTTQIPDKVTPNMDEIKAELSLEFSTRITQEFDQVKTILRDEIASLETVKTAQIPTDLSETEWPSFPHNKSKETRTSLVVKRDEASGKSVDLDKLEKTLIDHGIRVNSVHVSDTGDTFINLPDKSSSEKLQPLIRDAEPTNEIHTLKSKLPCIALLGVTRPYTKPEIENMILKQNTVIASLVEKGSQLKVLYTKVPEGDNTFHQVVLRVSPDIRRAIKSSGNKLHMGRVVHKVVDRFYIRRCNGCQSFGHYQDKCPTKASPICGYCSEAHQSKNCPIKNGPHTAYTCHNCSTGGLVANGHSTFFRDCPAYKLQQKKLEKSIDYDYQSN